MATSLTAARAASLDDLGAGRIDVGFLDPLIIIAAQKERPGLNIETQ